MKRNNPIMAALLMAGLLTAASHVQAADQSGTYMSPSAPTAFVQNKDQPETYGETVGRKLTSGLANIATATLEVPKSTILINNRSNFIFGLVGGIAQGGINTLGRISVGVIDLLSAPIPTKAFVYPLYVWDDFDAETTYGPVFRLTND